MGEQQLLTLKEASDWASYYIGQEITESNISYLIQYGRILRYDENGNLKSSTNGITKVSLLELKKYYKNRTREKKWKQTLGDELNWHLSFENIPERDRTKHVHRLHQYKGKFIPQLVEYFLDNHVNDFKKRAFFKEGDIILDPFAGSGTTLVQCLELGMHSIGIDISRFNCMISETKTQKYDLKELVAELRRAQKETEIFSTKKFRNESDISLRTLLSSINMKYYPSPDFRILMHQMYSFQSKIKRETESLLSVGAVEKREKALIDLLKKYSSEKTDLEQAARVYTSRLPVPFEFKITSNNVENLVTKFSTKYADPILEETYEKAKIRAREKQTTLDFLRIDEPFSDSPFLSSWFTKRQQVELEYYRNQINAQKDPRIQNIMKIILSRAARSCRATRHIDLATLIEPQTNPYYCTKHFKVCTPVTTILRHLKRYTEDTIKRVEEFSRLRKDVYCEVINADSRKINILGHVKRKNERFYNLLKTNKINGIFTSPPYVGQIDYHEQHAYSYELFEIDRKDEFEIGKKSNGKSKNAQQDYVNGISTVLVNVQKFLRKDSNIFIVANDKKNLYPTIAKKSGLEIIKTHRRPVLNRTERDKQPYSESIFHMVLE